MKACGTCGCYCRPTDDTCHQCGASLTTPRTSAAAALLGLALSGCFSQAIYGVPDTAAQAEYGVPDTAAHADADEDGWTPAEGDCNDDDASIHPEAPETPDDGIDSNCGGGDDWDDT